jgi:3-methyl-2-oxobutanoate hydroxymethyltransferase
VSHAGESNPKKATAAHIRNRKNGLPIVALTAHDYASARLVDEAGFDIILVGDSLAQTVLGYDSTLPVTLDEMIAACRAVRRGAKRALIVGDLPFGSYQDSVKNAVASAIRFVKEGGAEAVKLEGGAQRADIVKAIVDSDVPVMGHIGLTPQSVLRMGGYKVQGKTLEAARTLIEDARALERAGAFSIVLEGIPAEIGKLITERVTVPTIGNGQILVFSDLIGLTFGSTAKFVRRYADVKATIFDALNRFAADVTTGRYPAAEESYHLPDPISADVEEEPPLGMPPLGPLN